MGTLKLGMLEKAIRITSKDGRCVETVTTPSMWALADEFCDELRLTKKHTEAWILRKLGFAINMQAARAEGLFDDGPIDLASLAEFLNDCTVEAIESETDSSGADKSADPTQAAPADDPEAA